METINPVLRSIIADLFVNLSAGWIGAVIIVPNFTSEKGKRKWLILTGDIFAAILFLFIAFLFRSLL